MRRREQAEALIRGLPASRYREIFDGRRMKRGLIFTMIGAVVVSVLFTKDWSDLTVVLTRFLRARNAQDLAEVYEHLSASDRAFRSLDSYIAREGFEDSIVVSRLLKRSTFEIESMDLTSETSARARVRMSEPDMDVVMGEMMKEVSQAIGSGMDADEFDSSLERRYLGRKVAMRSRQVVYALVQEEGRWRVDLRWPLRAEIGSLLLQGARRERQEDLAGARDDYRAALALDDTQIELDAQIVRVSEAMLPHAERNRKAQEAMDAAFYEILDR